MEYFLKETRKLMRQTIRERAQDELLELLSCHFQTAGKMNRPRAVALLTQALEADTEAAIGWAAALEMFHNGSLIHDDLQDGDTFRRGAPSLWSSKGKNKAMNAGTFLMLNGHACLRESKLGKNKYAELSDLLGQCASLALEGQCLEAGLNQMERLRGLRALYFRVIRLKTGALFAKLAAGVGIIADLKREDSEKLEEIFEELGTLFQIQDDILDLYGDKRRDMQGNDIKEGKVSFLILKHLELYHYDFETIRKTLFKGRNETDRGEILILKEQFTRDGTLEGSLEEFAQRCERLIGSKFLREKPRVKAALGVLTEELVKPLSHLRQLNEQLQALSKLRVRQASGAPL